MRVDRRQRHRVPREAGRAASRRPVSSLVVGHSVVVIVEFEIAAREDRGNAVRAVPSPSGVGSTPLPLILRSIWPLPRCPLLRGFVWVEIQNQNPNKLLFFGGN